ncbi:helix-turn-helix domain-containing protein [Chryseobacterium angstadtii]|nr:helix-turn-helix transcriptional regulator [Chryseobacterium angstadtii]
MTMTLGAKLTRLRNNKGYTQQEVADRLQISQPAYSK